MKTKTISGKVYVEYNDYKKLKNKTIINITFLILLSVAIVLLFMAITTIVNNKELVSQQPIDYVMDKYGFITCNCIDTTGQIFTQGSIITEVPEVIG